MKRRTDGNLHESAPRNAFVTTGRSRPFGAQEPRDLARVEVREGSAAFRAMRLSKTTYFYASHLVVMKPEALTATETRCPPDVYLALKELVDMR